MYWTKQIQWRTPIKSHELTARKSLEALANLSDGAGGANARVGCLMTMDLIDLQFRLYLAIIYRESLSQR